VADIVGVRSGTRGNKRAVVLNEVKDLAEAIRTRKESWVTK